MTSGGAAGKARAAYPFLAAWLLATASCRTRADETVAHTVRREYATAFPEVWTACVAGILEADLRIQAGWMTTRGGELIARGFEGSEVTVRLAARGNGGTVVRVSSGPAYAPRAAALLERIAGSLKGKALLKGAPSGIGEVGAALSLR